MRAFRTGLVAVLLIGSLPLSSIAQTAIVDESLRAMRAADSDEAFFRAMQDIVTLGPDVVPELSDRLLATDDVWERVDLTAILTMVLQRAEQLGQASEAPPELIEEVVLLMDEPTDPTLEANLVNLAGQFRPQPVEITEGLLAVLARTDDEPLRATTSAVIAMNGGEQSRPLVHDALRRSDNERLSGDLALILYGSELPDDIASILVELRSSDNAEARQLASRTLEAAGYGVD